MASSVVVMGVSGCGKSSLASALAHALDWRYIEGDAHHSEANLAKMKQGVALTDADRDGWLGVLAAELQRPPLPALLTCSALKRAYRDRLRAAAPGLRFVFMDIGRGDALQRVASRGVAGDGALARSKPGLLLSHWLGLGDIMQVTLAHAS